MSITMPIGPLLKQQNDSDRAWRYFGKADPYYGVLSAARFKTDQLDEHSRREFFAAGERDVGSVVEFVREHLDTSFRPARTLDFGCGVGRLTIPLARLSGSVVGVDVSASMLAEARRNTARLGLSNVSFAVSDDALSRVTGEFDFVHSHLVFQHIPPARGEAVFRRLVALLKEGGIGALHVTFRYQAPAVRKLVAFAYRNVPLAFGVRNVLRGAPFTEPMMLMNEYDLSRLFGILSESRVSLVHARLDEASVFGHPFQGAMLFFRKQPSAGA